MSEDYREYLSAVARVVDEIERGAKRVALGCEGGCGRTSTVFLSTAALLTGGDVEKVKDALEAFEEVRGCGPEVETQRRVIALFLALAKERSAWDTALREFEEVWKRTLGADVPYEASVDRSSPEVLQKFGEAYVELFEE